MDVGAPADESGWGVRGAVTMGDSGSWVLAGSYLAELTADHVIALGASYSKQRPPQEVDLTSVERSTSNLYADREVGSVKADGQWTLSRRMSVGYGAALARYGYLEQGRLFSPHAEVVVEPVARTRVRVAVARNMSAPGAEEFLPSAAGFWLPPERTFAPLSSLEPLQAQRTRHVELALERDLGSASIISVRRFQQRVASQTITVFGVEPGGASSASDHYYLANARGLDAAGWGVSLSHELAGRVRGAVAYSVTRSQWEPWRGAWFLPQAASVWRTGPERFHDVTTSVEAEIPETATSVFVLARVNTAFSRAAAMSVGPGVGRPLRVSSQADSAVRAVRRQRLGVARRRAEPAARADGRCVGLRRAAGRQSPEAVRGRARRALLTEAPVAARLMARLIRTIESTLKIIWSPLIPAAP